MTSEGQKPDTGKSEGQNPDSGNPESGPQSGAGQGPVTDVG